MAFVTSSHDVRSFRQGISRMSSSPVSPVCSARNTDGMSLERVPLCPKSLLTVLRVSSSSPCTGASYSPLLSDQVSAFSARRGHAALRYAGVVSSPIPWALAAARESSACMSRHVQLECHAQPRRQVQSDRSHHRSSPKPSSVSAAAPGTATRTLQINGRTLTVVRELGRGAFGVVWEAQDLMVSTRSVAVKLSSSCRPHILALAVQEACLLKQLTALLDSCAGAELRRRMPQYISHSKEEGKVTLAMTKLKGKPLDQWLYGMSDVGLSGKSIPQLLDGPFPSGEFGTCDFHQACTITSLLVSQLVPVFSLISQRALHRDVSAHNLMVDVVKDGKLEFGVIDFGLAVPSQSWQHEWRCTNIAGDPRYWSPATWMLVSGQSVGLSSFSDESFQRHYEQRFDHFPFGLVLLEAFFSLWHGQFAESAAQFPSLRKAQERWRNYWAKANSVARDFHKYGVEVMRKRLVDFDIGRIVSNAVSLVSALGQAQRELQPYHAEVSGLLRVMADFVDTTGTLSWNGALGELKGSEVVALAIATPQVLAAAGA